MRVLADTGVWIDHLRSHNAGLAALLSQDLVVAHDHVIGELAMGSLKDRREFVRSLLDLRRAPLAEESEVRDFVEARRLFARGVGYSDAHLLASLMLDGAMTLWTTDMRLATVAAELGIAYQRP
jgi:predicted nucleic acid-binding protein